MTQTTKVNLPIELVATTEEIVTHSVELAGREVRVIVLPDKTESSFTETSPPVEHSTAATLLQNASDARSWEGDDFEECLQMVYDMRGKF